MEKNDGNIVMFPKWKSRLESTGLQALKEKKYEEALEALQPLLDYGVASNDVVTGILMSWIELGNFDEAEELCQKQMKENMDQYYHYLHIYITILFQSNRYQDIVDLLDEVFEEEEIPHQTRTQLWQMYEVSRKLLEDYHKEKGKELHSDFLEALEKDDVRKQWVLLEQLKKQPAQSYIDTFTTVLQNKTTHPIIKTAIIEWFRDSQVDQSLSFYKFGQQMEINPLDLNPLQSDYILKQIQMRLSGIEQSNPTMYEMLNKFLSHYCYVRYPIYPDEQEVPAIVEALKQLGHEYLQLPYHADQGDEQVQTYKEEIELCEQHYLLIVGESP
ncbi:tetratricopeptide repeat protein [Halobacillus mangrovi]|uniref:tetratricopeptide repeat protein n=1 Tax=Halobacillus mangrovi TaxID=402384 RepID=UPI003D992AC2